jgi:hypothetical protein
MKRGHVKYLRALTVSLTVFMIFSVVSGCMPSVTLSLGQFPAADPSSVIRTGVTTRQGIQDAFGPPDFEGIDRDGLPKWTYTRIGIRVEKAKDARITRFFNLSVSFRDNVVDSYTFDRKSGEETK